jgi:hypothetical protein
MRICVSWLIQNDLPCTRSEEHRTHCLQLNGRGSQASGLWAPGGKLREADNRKKAARR